MLCMTTGYHPEFVQHGKELQGISGLCNYWKMLHFIDAFKVFFGRWMDIVATSRLFQGWKVSTVCFVGAATFQLSTRWKTSSMGFPGWNIFLGKIGERCDFFGSFSLLHLSHEKRAPGGFRAHTLGWIILPIYIYEYMYIYIYTYIADGLYLPSTQLCGDNDCINPWHFGDPVIKQPAFHWCFPRLGLLASRCRHLEKFWNLKTEPFRVMGSYCCL